MSPQEVSGWACFMNDERYLYLDASLDVGAPAGDPDYATSVLYSFFEDEPPIGDGKWAANLCTQNPDEGGYVSKVSDFDAAGYDEDYFAPLAESDWACPPLPV